MMETKYLEIKNDCMWNGNCDRKCLDSYKMENFISKSSLTNDTLNDLYLNLCGGHMFTTNGQDTLDFLDSLDTDDFNVSDLLINNSCTSSITPSTNSVNNTGMNNIQQSINHNQIKNNSYYLSNQSFSSTNLINNQLTNQTQQIKLLSISSPTTETNHNNDSISNQFNTTTTQTSITSSSNQLTPNHQTIASQHQSSSKFQSLIHSTDTSSLLSSSLNNEKNNSYLNDLLLNSNSANIILTQHNQPVDNSSQLSNVVDSNQINYHHSNDNNSLTNLTNTCTDIVVSSCTNDDLADLSQTGHFNTHLQSTNLNQHQFNNYQISNSMISSSYAFDHQLMDSTFGSSAVSCDSVGSSNNSECSNSVLERTDYDTDDIEDDLDLLEDIIEEECDEMPFINQYQSTNHTGLNSRLINCHSIANSLESSSDFEMIASPISDSLINDHSYGAIDKLIINPNCIGLNSSSIKSKNLTNNSITITTTSNGDHYETEINSKSTKISKRRSLGNLTTNNNQTNRKNMQRRSGTSLLMKEKQSKIKKVMDTERRKEHNESERMRRGVLKNAFLNLRNKCPKLQNSSKKSSRIQILNEATTYIYQMIDKGRQLESLKQQELQRKMELLDRLKGLSGN